MVDMAISSPPGAPGHISASDGTTTAAWREEGAASAVGCTGRSYRKGDGWNGVNQAQKVWERYCEFRRAPGQKCPDCWLLQRFCCCAEVDRHAHGRPLRLRVIVLMHPAELNELRSSNTAKLLLRFGAELSVWGLEDHAKMLQGLLELVPKSSAAPEEGKKPSISNAAVLFPSSNAIDAASLANSLAAERAQVVAERQHMDEQGKNVTLELSHPRTVIVLDGGWKETQKMNKTIDPRILRVRVTPDSYKMLGGYTATRKYDAKLKPERVQTAAAFLGLLNELQEDRESIDALSAGLNAFTAAFNQQLIYSGVQLAMQRAPCSITLRGSENNNISGRRTRLNGGYDADPASVNPLVTAD